MQNYLHTLLILYTFIIVTYERKENFVYYLNMKILFKYFVIVILKKMQ